MIVFQLVASLAFAPAAGPTNTQTPAVARDERHFTGSRIPRTIEIPVSTTASTDIGIGFQTYSKCVVEKAPKLASNIVAPDPFVGGKARAPFLEEGKRKLEACMNSINGARLKSSPQVLVGALAEQLYRAKYPSLPPLGEVALTEPRYEELRSRYSLYVVANCVIGRNAQWVDYLIRSASGSPQEDASLKALSGDLGSCLDAGNTLQFNRLTLRTAFADQLYRRAIAGSADSSSESAARTVAEDTR
jgi:hypothetical protein